jgi:hypothetical protein
MSGYEIAVTIMVDAAALPDQHVRKEFGRLARSRRRLRFADAWPLLDSPRDDC